MADQVNAGGGGGVTGEQLNMEEKASSTSTMASPTLGEPRRRRQQEEGGEIEMGSNDGASVVVEQVPTVNVEEILKTIRAMKVADASGGDKASSGIVEGGGTQAPSPQSLKDGKDLGKAETVEGGQKESELSIGKLATEVFPEEVWRIILGKVPDPNDLCNCTNTCQLFETILRPWKTGWMLEQALPYMYRHLTGKKLLECRLVSKGWNAAVDHFLEDHPSLRPYDGARDPRRLEFVCPMKEKRICEPNYFTFGNWYTFNVDDSYLAMMPDKKRNPFIGRYVTLRLMACCRLVGEDDEGQNEVEKLLWDRLYRLLDLYGKGIWYLHISFYYEYGTNLLVPRRMVEFLTAKVFELLPNLRKFSMDNIGSCYLDQKLRVNIDPESLPCAPKLETFSWRDYAFCDHVMEALMERHHLQIRKLVLESGPWERARQLDWPNLTELHVDFERVKFSNQWDETYRTGTDLKLLCGVRMPNLCKLILNLPGVDVSCDHLLEAINELASTTRLSVIRIVGPVRQLKVGVPPSLKFDIDTDSSPPSKIKNLEFSPPGNVRPLWNWDFVVRCFPLVENLNVFVEKHGDYRFNGYHHECCLWPIADLRKEVEGRELKDPVKMLDVNEYIFDGQMYKSNIWEKLPRLKVFSFQWDVFTREEYEAYANEGDREGAKQE